MSSPRDEREDQESRAWGLRVMERSVGFVLPIHDLY